MGYEEILRLFREAGLYVEICIFIFLVGSILLKVGADLGRKIFEDAFMDSMEKYSNCSLCMATLLLLAFLAAMVAR